MKEILELEKQIEETNKHIEELKKQLEELKEIAKQDKKEHKSLSDYRCYRELGEDNRYKYIDCYSEVDESIWKDEAFDEAQLSIGNIYSIDTPNELLEREIKKRQLWFALEKHLKEKGCLATNEDWKDKSKDKYYITLDYSDKKIKCFIVFDCKENTIYSTNGEILRNYMNTLTKEDIKIMFDVE